jgi:hypothetical protein
VEDLLTRFVEHLIGRVHGPMTFRLLLQPAMALLCAVRDGVKDAREGRPPYFWALFTHAGARSDLLREGSRAVARILVLGVVMDLIYQLIVFRWLYPLELVTMALLLAFVPYLLARGPVNRVVRFWITRSVSSSSSRRRPHSPNP